ncbi:MAG: hypothetical protein ACOYH4_04760 [Saccharofermentanales bacterium]|jgi:hypothetical protein
MKKCWLVILTVVCCAAVACTTAVAPPPEGSGQAEIVNPNATTAPPSIPNDTTMPPTQAPSSVSDLRKDAFVFIAPDGTEIMPTVEADRYADLLERADEVLSAPSCVFEGEDTVYVFPTFEVQVGTVGGVAYVTSIVLTAPSVSTAEGLSVTATKDEMLEIYGNDYVEQFGQYIYERTPTQLILVLDPETELVMGISYMGLFDDLR